MGKKSQRVIALNVNEPLIGYPKALFERAKMRAVELQNSYPDDKRFQLLIAGLTCSPFVVEHYHIVENFPASMSPAVPDNGEETNE